VAIGIGIPLMTFVIDFVLKCGRGVHQPVQKFLVNVTQGETSNVLVYLTGTLSPRIRKGV
jgi:hypothetical protein